jgi:Xaa-Pro aminopeptidase
MDLQKIQQEIRKQQLDGWLFFDHHMRDPLAYRVLGITPPRTPTRRWYYLIPAEGEPCGMEHRIERGMTGALPGGRIAYSSWTEQVAGIQKLVGGMRRIAMQYSPNCAIPYVSMVDAGTIELVRAAGPEVVSSAELIQAFEAKWTAEQLDSHLEAGRRVDRVRQSAFEYLRERLRNGVATTELDVKRFVLGGFKEAGMFTDHGPIVGVNANASNPHYEPTEASHAPIHDGDLVLLDLWAKLDRPDAVYYDITWTHFLGANPPEKMLEVFAVVTGARDAAIARVTSAKRALPALVNSRMTSGLPYMSGRAKEFAMFSPVISGIRFTKTSSM